MAEFAKAEVLEGKRVVPRLHPTTAPRAKRERLSLLIQPAYTPEMNPCERVWPIVKEGIANQSHKDLEELEEKVCKRCQEVSQEPTKVAALTHYHWWEYA